MPLYSVVKRRRIDSLLPDVDQFLFSSKTILVTSFWFIERTFPLLPAAERFPAALLLMRRGGCCSSHTVCCCRSLLSPDFLCVIVSMFPRDRVVGSLPLKKSSVMTSVKDVEKVQSLMEMRRVGVKEGAGMSNVRRSQCFNNPTNNLKYVIPHF